MSSEIYQTELKLCAPKSNSFSFTIYMFDVIGYYRAEIEIRYVSLSQSAMLVTTSQLPYDQLHFNWSRWIDDGTLLSVSPLDIAAPGVYDRPNSTWYV